VQPVDIMQLREPRTRVPELEHQENSLACSLSCSFHRYFACPRYWKLGHQEKPHTSSSVSMALSLCLSSICQSRSPGLVAAA